MKTQKTMNGATHNFGSHLSLINLMVACGFLGVSAPRFME